jgi:hypothetical protein
MTDAILPGGRFSQADFRIGGVLSRTAAILSRNFATFFIVMAIASLPMLLFLDGPTVAAGNPFLRLSAAKLIVSLMLSALGGAIVVYGAVQDLRSCAFSLGESFQVAANRFIPVMRVTVCATFLSLLGSVLLVVPGLILATMWFVAIPACVVERSGVFASMGRSRQLTEGHRRKIFGMMMMTLIPGAIMGKVINLALVAVAGAGTIPALAGHVMWSGIWGAFYTILAVVAYHDLRVLQEGGGSAQIAAVFD